MCLCWLQLDNLAHDYKGLFFLILFWLAVVVVVVVVVVLLFYTLFSLLIQTKNQPKSKLIKIEAKTQRMLVIFIRICHPSHGCCFPKTMILCWNIDMMMGFLFSSSLLSLCIYGLLTSCCCRFKIEPSYFCPILPTILLNGAEGLGTGWSTQIPGFHPLQIVDNMLVCSLLVLVFLLFPVSIRPPHCLSISIW